MLLLKKYFVYILFLFSFFSAQAQVNTVVFGKNRLQFKKFNWKFYQSPNFNTYTSQGGTELGKFVAQIAEEELPSLEKFTEYALQRRTNIVVYNSYDDFKQSNIGIGADWQNAGGLTKLVNNKLVVYFDGNHNKLKEQIRQGIAKVLVDNLLFGDDIGEFASNQALLDLPKWLVDGYVSYAATPWSTELDDQLRNEILGVSYKSFYQFAFVKPLLAGHAFWHYMADKYREENVTYFFYLARMYKSVNKASEKICKKKFKAVLADFMEYQNDLYSKDLRSRRNAPKGSVITTEDISQAEYYRFQANPNLRNNNYVMVEFKRGVYKVKYVDNISTKTLLDKGVRTNQGDINPNYPILAWDTKGTRILVIYNEQGKNKMFVYDVVRGYKTDKQTLSQFDQILDATYMLDPNTILLSAVKNGHSDIYTFKIDNQKITQITNDTYDDLNPTYVSFPNRQGIIFSSNRPTNNQAVNADTVLPSNYRFNVFIVDILNNGPTKQIAQLTNMKYGNATKPMQYNTNHFTFISDENGINNRWAGFFSTQRNGLDTLYYIGEELLRNPSAKEFDSTLKAWQKQEPDSISYFQIYKDSTYTFPITNYQTSLLETRVAGNNGQVSETRREGDYKYLYKLRVNEDALRRRNVQAKPSIYMSNIINKDKFEKGGATKYKNNKPVEPTIEYNPKAVMDSVKKRLSTFQNEFEDDIQQDSTITALVNQLKQPSKQIKNYLTNTKLYNYKLKFSSDYVLAGITNNILINRYQPYAGGSGPIQLNNGTDANWSFRVGVSDLMEDIKFVGGFRFGLNFNLSDKDVFFTFMNLRKRLDWDITYFRSTITNFRGAFDPNNTVNGLDPNLFNNRLFTNMYQLNLSYPLNEVKSIRLSNAFRTDRITLRPASQFGTPDALTAQAALKYPDSLRYSILSRIEFVHDNTINPTQNIWNGTRYKVYLDYNMPFGSNKGNTTFNFGFDGRIYKPIYRNFIWAGRAAADISWGNQRVVYFLGGVDGWLGPRFNQNPPAQDQRYAFQSLAINMRGYNQNIANGNNAFVINSEFRFPVFATLFNRPINNAFLRNFQLVQFVDLGTAWNGQYNGIKRPTEIYQEPNNPVTIRIDAGGLGPFAGGYGFGVRSTLLGYFLKFDLAWPMKGVFRGQPLSYIALGFDF
jgi:hypothetical protein